MNNRPLIGINMDLRASVKSRTPHSLTPTGYYDALLTAGALPIMIPPFTRESDMLPILDRLDGVVLTGGDDLDPRKMGLAPHPSVNVMCERRELSDRLLCKLIQQEKVPTLGIGLGMQELNVVAGGGLFVHLPEDLPKCIPHFDPHGGAHRHTVVMRPKTRLAEIYGPGEIRVSSYHHMGVRKLAQPFRISALAPDGLIEAYEGKDPSWWVVGVQWHPENEGHISLDMQLIEAFVEASVGFRSAPTLSRVG
ncbi:gamma-glutamyl-gamma-aminobutyrate hydrolase family protein [Paludisphaera rhizosphaerae]|uniref:gamma-glutamyl-gamma-aminobutyrate hydrolase family protein n=1 Tax=Paludisphaera rhizosphaerae TaxID=2711216 RepID=UPI0013EAAA3C|nr:gamma-glutamyl-gamma-aminobutyrate hydrolase family protein [Paludisphaera rhizosphaerae]